MIINIQTYDEFVNYILVELGHPIIHQEVAKIQVKHAIDKALRYYISKTSMESTRRKVIKITIDDPTSIVLPAGTMAINEVLKSKSGTLSARFGEGVLFDDYSLAWRSGSSYNNYDIISYELYAEYATMVENHFSGGVKFEFSSESRELNIVPTPKIGDEIFLEVEARYDIDSPVYYNNIWIRAYAVAWSKSYWGFNLSKFGDRQLSGGANVNANFIYTEGKSDVEALEEKFKSEYSAGSDLYVG